MNSSKKPLHSNNPALKALSNLALTSAKIAANTSCAYIYHQPPKPTELKCLKKF